MNGREDSESEGIHHSFERLMTQNGNSDRLREAFLQELLKSDWKEQVDIVVVYLELFCLLIWKKEMEIRNLSPFPILRTTRLSFLTNKYIMYLWFFRLKS